MAGSADGRRAFLARLGALATAPVLTAFVPSEGGLAVPSKEIEVARALPAPMVISSLVPPSGAFQPGEVVPAPHGQIVVWIDGEPWRINAYRG